MEADSSTSADVPNRNEHDARKTKTCTECAEQTLYDSCGYTDLQLKFLLLKHK